MGAYILRRLLLIPLTLVGILTVNFFIAQLAPGGPVDLMLAKLEGGGTDALSRLSGAAGQGEVASAPSPTDKSGSAYRGRQGLDPEFIRQIEAQFGFDKPLHERYLKMLGDYLRFDLGESFYRSQKVTDLVLEKLPVSMSLGIASTLIIYLVSVPLGIWKAVRDGSRFDVISSWVVIIGYAIPGFLFAILLVVLLAGGRYLTLFPCAV